MAPRQRFWNRKDFPHRTTARKVLVASVVERRPWTCRYWEKPYLYAFAPFLFRSSLGDPAMSLSNFGVTGLLAEHFRYNEDDEGSDKASASQEI